MKKNLLYQIKVEKYSKRNESFKMFIEKIHNSYYT